MNVPPPAFKSKYWAANKKIHGYSQMEQNFTLVSDATADPSSPKDRP
jgi:hypothetical protein